MTEATPKKATRTRKPAAKKTTTTTKKAASLDLPTNPLLFEIFDLCSRQRSKAKKVEVLQKYGSPAVKSVLIWNFDETVLSALPEGDVPYAEPEEQLKYEGSLSEKIAVESRTMYQDGSFSLGTSDPGAKTTITAQAKNLYHFIVGGNGGLSSMRRESMFINLLQSLHPLEAEIICLVKDGRLGEQYKITQEIVAEAFPTIRWGGRS